MPPPFASAEVMTAAVAPLGGRPREACVVLYVDAERRLIGCRHVVGSADAVVLSIRTIAADALTFGARAAVVAHNHPSGDAEPSERDLAFTRALARGLDALGVVLRDHVIVAGDRAVSLRARGVI